MIIEAMIRNKHQLRIEHLPMIRNKHQLSIKLWTDDTKQTPIGY